MLTEATNFALVRPDWALVIKNRIEPGNLRKMAEGKLQRIVPGSGVVEAKLAREDRLARSGGALDNIDACLENPLSKLSRGPGCRWPRAPGEPTPRRRSGWSP
jgi:hypothetical protein